MIDKSLVIVDLFDRRRTSSARAQSRGIEMLVQALEARSISVARALTAQDAMKLVDLLHPGLLLIDPSIPDAFVAIGHARRVGADVLVMSESDVALNRARSLGLTRTVLKGDGWDTVMDATSSFFGDDSEEVQADTQARVLVVDAVREVAELMARFLNTRGFAATAALTGSECMEILQKDPSIDAVVLDMLLPDKGGMEIIAALSRQRRRPALILTSPVADSELAQNARRLGAFDFMTKPIDLQALEIDLVASLAHSEYLAQPWWKRLVGGTAIPA
jgi:DNA-binding response OmpR family regulator